jgi:hypothetical protein
MSMRKAAMQLKHPQLWGALSEAICTGYGHTSEHALRVDVILSLPLLRELLFYLLARA